MSEEVVTPPAEPQIEESALSPRRQAIIILEVLAGTRGVPQAAAELSVSVNRYYQLEERAISGLVGAMAPSPRGPSRDLEQEVRRLEREKLSLQDECARYQALVRATQRSVGIDVEEAQRHAPRAARRMRRPVVRALRAVERLQTTVESNESET